MGGSMGTNTQQFREPIADSSFTSPDVNTHFRRLDDGRTVFYPMGLFGRRGFVVASMEQEALLRVHARGARKRGAAGFLLNFLGLIAIGIFAPSQRLVLWLYGGFVVALLTATWLFMRFYSRHLTKGMESANVRNSPIAYWRSWGRTMTPLQLILQMIAAVGTGGVFVCLAVFLDRPDLFLFSGLMAVNLVPLGFALRGALEGIPDAHDTGKVASQKD